MLNLKEKKKAPFKSTSDASVPVTVTIQLAPASDPYFESLPAIQFLTGAEIKLQEIPAIARACKTIWLFAYGFDDLELAQALI